MDDILAGLNDEQRAAAEHGTGPLLVVAGAGTGKTRVITHRIAYLIRSGRARPGQILALTFTEKAAREMEERLYELIGWESFQVPVMTFNAFGAELLGRFASHIGRSISGGLLNDTQKALLMKQHIDRVDLKYFGPQQDMFEFLEGIVAYIGQLQNAGVSVADYAHYLAELEAEPGDLHPQAVVEQADLARLYRLYEELKVETGTYDYNDQLGVPLEIMRQRPNVAEQLQHEYAYVLVDEYQDTNPVQDQLLRKLVSPTGNLFAVGDDDQAIYGFRGADIRNILNFSQHFSISQPITLVHNYRSGQQILDAAYRMVVNNNPERLESKLGLNKRLIANNDEATIDFSAYSNSYEELERVASHIYEQLQMGVPSDQIAVLSAQHAPLAALGRLLRQRGLPFALSTRVNIFEQPELIGLWFLLRWLLWQTDDAAMSHIMMGPVLGWPADRVQAVVTASQEALIGIEEALATDAGEDARALTSQLGLWREWAVELPVSQLLYRLVFETGLAESWQRQAAVSPRMVRVFEDLQRWLDQMQDFESVAIEPKLSEYVATFPKPPTVEVAEPIGDAAGVQLLTVHAAKGLEFGTVYLIGCTQRAWSKAHHAIRDLPEALQPHDILPAEHEFRRLLYVGVTRAKRQLFVSAAVGGSAGGGRQRVSRLVGELFGDERTEQTDATPSVAGDHLGDVIKTLQKYYPLQQQSDQSARLPFEAADGTLDISATGLASYEYCPFEFYLAHVLQIKQPIGPQITFGNALHKVFERYYKARLTGQRLAPQEPGDWLEELWSDRGYERREDADADHRLARETLGRFIEREAHTQRVLIGSEVPIRLEVAEARLRLRGKIDAIFQLADGVELRDFKTGRTKTDVEKLSKKAKDDLQLRTYALAYESLKGTPPAQVVLDYVVTGIEGTAVLTDTIMKHHREKLVKLADSIRAREFAPNPSPLHRCAAIQFYGTGERDELLELALTSETEP